MIVRFVVIDSRPNKPGTGESGTIGAVKVSSVCVLSDLGTAIGIMPS